MESGRLHMNSLCSSQAIGLMQCISEITEYHVCIQSLCYLQFWHKCSCCWNTVFVLMSTDKDIDRFRGKEGLKRGCEHYKRIENSP